MNTDSKNNQEITERNKAATEKSKSSESDKKEPLQEPLSGIIKLMGNIHVSPKKYHKERLRTLSDVANYIKSGDCTKIIVLVGAGISTSCGIPDFRSKKSGIFNSLEEYDLPFPEALFHIDFFRNNPIPFFNFSKTVIDKVDNARPSKAHIFLRMLADKGLLTRIYTQNIDNIEEKSGINPKLICQAHGSFHSAHCIDKSHSAQVKDVISKIKTGEIPLCSVCGSVVKPDITFYGESLPTKFFKSVSSDANNADLLIVMGTSLTVQPVASVSEMFNPLTPRLLINKKIVGYFKCHPCEESFQNIHGKGGKFPENSEKAINDTDIVTPKVEDVDNNQIHQNKPGGNTVTPKVENIGDNESNQKKPDDKEDTNIYLKEPQETTRDNLKNEMSYSDDSSDDESSDLSSKESPNHSWNESHTRSDVFFKGNCDDGCEMLINLLGWEEDFNLLLNELKEKEGN